jgi:hypothetical protein
MTGGPAGFATAAPSATSSLVGGARPASMLTSDEHSKTRIRDLETQLAAAECGCADASSIAADRIVRPTAA